VPDRRPPASAIRPAGRRRRDGAGRVRGGLFAVHVVLTLGAVVALTPFLTMIGTSLMTLGETYTRTPWPAAPQWQNYVQAWQDAHFDRFFRNSLIIAVVVILGVLTTCTLAGYAFARIRFPGRDALFTMLLATLMIPGTVTFIPSFLLVRGDVLPWGSWINTLPALTVPFMSTAFIVFLLRQFFAQIPDELWDAARIDGAGHVRFLVRVVVPMSRPVLLTATLLTFVNIWNEFLWPILVTTDRTWRPLSVGLYNFTQEAGAQTHLLMAGSVITIVPILLLYFLTQRSFTEGFATAGLKR
jgi:ABC-type glycerol-3-phosphate transport system permease component